MHRIWRTRSGYWACARRGRHHLDHRPHLLDPLVRRQVGVGAIVRRVTQLHVRQVLEQERAADQAGDEVVEGRVGRLLDLLHQLVHLQVVAQIVPPAGEEPLELGVGVELLEQRVAVALEPDVEDVRQDGPAEVQVQLGV